MSSAERTWKYALLRDQKRTNVRTDRQTADFSDCYMHGGNWEYKQWVILALALRLLFYSQFPYSFCVRDVIIQVCFKSQTKYHAKNIFKMSNTYPPERAELKM